MAQEPERENTVILPIVELFPPIIADQREYVFSIRYEAREQEERDFKAAEVSFGDSLPIVEYALTDDAKVQFTFDGVFYSLYDLDTTSQDLINTDFLVGISANFRRDNRSLRARLRHKSSHLGDEYILNNPDISRDNTSFEEIRLLPAYEWDGWRIYAGGGGIFRSEHNLDPWNVQGGVEYVIPSVSLGIGMFFAADFQSEDRANWQLNQSYRAGYLIGEGHSRVIRVAVEYVNGYAQDGQFIADDCRYFGLAVYFQL